MKANYAIDRRSGEVSVEREGTRLRILRDKRSSTFRFEHTKDGMFLRLEEKIWEVTLGSQHGDQIEMFVDGTAYLFTWQDFRRASAFEATGCGSEKREIRSIMPGRVSRLLVRPGEKVQTDQSLLVLEAMKMENEIKSPRAGVIETLAVTEGTSVEFNALLITFQSEGNGHG